MKAAKDIKTVFLSLFEFFILEEFQTTIVIIISLIFFCATSICFA